MKTILKAPSLFMVYFILEDGRKHKDEIGTCTSTLKNASKKHKQKDLEYSSLYFLCESYSQSSLSPPTP